jgi:hypothetical protein
MAGSIGQSFLANDRSLEFLDGCAPTTDASLGELGVEPDFVTLDGLAKCVSRRRRNAFFRK